MFLKAGALSLALLLASRLLGLVRESAQAAAFGATGFADVAVLMLTLPDWLAGVLASGALAYVLVPAWAGHDSGRVAATQRSVAKGLLAAGVVLAVLLLVLREPAARLLAGGVPPALLPAAADAMAWSAVALPAALLAALWVTRLQHERDFAGMYSANLVVNGVLIAGIVLAAAAAPAFATITLGAGLLAAMLLRLAWLHWRTPRVDAPAVAAPSLPPPPVWLWAAMSAGLPLALPFAARSIASLEGEGALATFNYAWKLVELPLILAVQLVATLAFPPIAKAIASGMDDEIRIAVRTAFALAFALASAAAAALLVGSPAIAALLFGWGRMDAQALGRIAEWGAIGAWGLLPQALIAVALTVLAARSRMRAAVFAYALALVILLMAASWGWGGGGRLMFLLNFLLTGVAVILLAAIGCDVASWLPWRAILVSAGCLYVAALLASQPLAQAWLGWPGLLAAGIAATAVLGATWWASADMREALAR
ncbi:MAG TPA: lipid II flippase MurJ [Ramlibacter sp.]|nr:lipid II flippase MurJ [Ramlibacter sp.]